MRQFKSVCRTKVRMVMASSSSSLRSASGNIVALSQHGSPLQAVRLAGHEFEVAAKFGFDNHPAQLAVFALGGPHQVGHSDGRRVLGRGVPRREDDVADVAA